MSPLHKACQYGRVQNVEKLINEGADVLATNDVYPSVLCRGVQLMLLSVGFFSASLGCERVYSQSERARFQPARYDRLFAKFV